MKKKLDYNPSNTSLVPVELSSLGRSRFPKYVGRKAWWVKYTSVRPRTGPLHKNDKAITVVWEGLKKKQRWHKDFFVQKITIIP